MQENQCHTINKVIERDLGSSAIQGKSSKWKQLQISFLFVGEMRSNLLQNKKQIGIFQAIKDKLIYPSASSSSLCFFPHRTETLQKKNSYLDSNHIFCLHGYFQIMFSSLLKLHLRSTVAVCHQL